MSDKKILTDEEIWKIINEKYSDKNDYTKNFIFRSIKKYGDIYTYEKSNREKWTDSVIVTCPIHGDLKAGSRYLTRNNSVGCPKCRKIKEMELQFIKRADKFEKNLKSKFPNYSIVDKSKYRGSNVDLLIRCNLDNCIFSIKPQDITKGRLLCPKCKEEKRKLELDLKLEKGFYKQFTDSELIKDYSGHYCRWLDEEENQITVKSKYTGEVEEILLRNIYNRISRGSREIFKSTRLIKKRDSFIKEAIKKYGDKFDYSKVSHIGFNVINPVTIVCKNCGKEFRISPNNFMRSELICCCEIIHKKFTNIINILKLYNFSVLTTEEEILHLGNFTINTVLTIKCNFCGSLYKMPVSYIKRKIRVGYNLCKNCNKESRSVGEKIIDSWLRANKIKFEKQVRLIDCIFGRNTKLVIVDFKLNINNKVYFIEYNGQQHYEWCKFFNNTKESFEKQIQRDVNLKNYCISKNILLIEIPYTYNSKESIVNILKEIFINNKDPKDVIVLPKIEEVC